jgi:hypothetical protein
MNVFWSMSGPRKAYGLLIRPCLCKYVILDISDIVHFSIKREGEVEVWTSAALSLKRVLSWTFSVKHPFPK